MPDRNENTEMLLRSFKCQLAPELLSQLDPHTRHMYETLDVLKQQNEHIIREQAGMRSRLEAGDADFKIIRLELESAREAFKRVAKLEADLLEAKAKIAAFEKLYLIFKSKKSVIVGFFAAFFIPLLIFVAGEVIVHWLTKGAKP